jgi:hypothetical protein
MMNDHPFELNDLAAQDIRDGSYTSAIKTLEHGLQIMQQEMKKVKNADEAHVKLTLPSARALFCPSKVIPMPILTQDKLNEAGAYGPHDPSLDSFRSCPLRIVALGSSDTTCSSDDHQDSHVLSSSETSSCDDIVTVLLFNLSLAFHLKALKATADGNEHPSTACSHRSDCQVCLMRNALKLYEHTYQILSLGSSSPGDSCLPRSIRLSILVNSKHLHELLGNASQVELFSQEILSDAMSLSQLDDSDQHADSDVDDDMLWVRMLLEELFLDTLALRAGGLAPAA